MSSLRRVSSRQRLVSWDAFDATVYYDSTEEDENLKARVSNPDSSSHCLNSMMMPRPSSTTTVILQPYNSDVEYSGSSANVDTVHDDFGDHSHKNEEEEGDDDSFDFKRKRRWYPTTRMMVTPPSHGYCFNTNATMTSFSPPDSSHEKLYMMPPTFLIPKSHPNDGLDHSAGTTSAMSTTTPTKNSSAAAIIQLPMEVQCMIYQYLTMLELRHVTQICTTLRQSLILSSSVEHPSGSIASTDHSNEDDDDDDVKSSNDTEEEQEGMNCIVESALWKPLCIHQYWPFLQPHQHLPFITSITQTHHDLRKNYPVLLSMAISKVPTHIDTTLFPYSCHLRRNPSGNLQLFVEELPEPPTPTSPNVPVVRPMSRFLHPKLISMNCIITTTTTTTSITNMATIKDATQYELGQQQQNHQVIQFIGKVGFGDQCIRSNAPLPRPIHIKGHTAKWNFQNRPYDPTTSTSTLFQRVFRNTIHSSNSTAPTAMMMRRSSIDTTPITASLFCPLRRSVRIAARRGSSVSSNITNTGTTTTTTPTSSVVRKRIPYRPFCVPFITHTNEINIAPRYIAYYEVTILPLPQRSDNNNTNNCTATITNTRYTKERKTTVSKVIQYPQNHPDTATTTTTNNRHVTTAAAATPFGTNSSVSDCVAVGIGTENFPLQHRMPGWDHNSYGYHGDDGGIFHGNGSMIQQYNRTFGVNDTIGCGIDYIQNSIFFTLNGVFLGYAFPLLPKHRDIDMYPIIGMDTQYPILCNFNGPFVFDLPSMIQQHDTILQEQLNL